MFRYQDWGQEQTLLVYMKDPTDAQVSEMGEGADISSLYEGSQGCSGIRTGGRSSLF
jgi:hypothetical protein